MDKLKKLMGMLKDMSPKAMLISAGGVFVLGLVIYLEFFK